MKDIIEIQDGQDMLVLDSVVSKAGNVISIQIGALEYAQEFGVDFKFFLESDFQIQNESFKSYLIQRLTENQVNVGSVLETFETLYRKYTYFVGSTKPGGLIT